MTELEERVAKLEACYPALQGIVGELQYIRGRVDTIAAKQDTAEGIKVGRRPWVQWFVTIATAIIVSSLTGVIAASIASAAH